MVETKKPVTCFTVFCLVSTPPEDPLEGNSLKWVFLIIFNF